MNVGLSVGDVMTHRPIYVPPNITVSESAKIMRNKEIGSLLITQEDEFLGIVTQTDIIEKVVAMGLPPNTTPIQDIMTTKVISIAPGDDLMRAMELMKEYDIRHLPVLKSNRLVGFLTVKDVLKVEPALFDMMHDQIRLREEHRKMTARHQGEEAFCEVCGIITTKIRRLPDGRMGCDDCAD